MSVVGLLAWAKDGKASEEGEIILNKITGKYIWISAALVAVGSPICILIFKAAGDPRPVLDGMVTLLSILGTWWLTKSYIEQWFVWIIADLLNAILFILQLTDGVDLSMGPLLMNLAFLASSVVGYFYWKKKGTYKTL